ncbi:methyltransferase domain-containing protein [Candidatus Woesearchaeota archaeon]|nr:methyltransferase domain-containing protein [Candidatus Woesearchaeota archaeon]
MNSDEDQFIIGLLELQYNSSISPQLKPLTQNIPWAKGWPENHKSFWNAEAFMWQRKIDSHVRKFITNELQHLEGRNLDLGCGSYCYIPSVGFDLSEKMLDFNDNLIEKIEGDVEQPLPFPNLSFDSVTAIFVLNYIKNYEQLFSEIKRILKPEGQFIMILSSKNIKDWQRQKEVNTYSKEKWCSLLKECGFLVTAEELQNLLFFTSKIQKTY